MQADGWLIQDVADADEPGADLRGQADALRFAAGKCAGFAIEREIAQSDVEHEPEAGGDLAHDRLGDLLPSSLSRSFSKNFLALATVSRMTSSMLKPGEAPAMRCWADFVRLAAPPSRLAFAHVVSLGASD